MSEAIINAVVSASGSRPPLRPEQDPLEKGPPESCAGKIFSIDRSKRCLRLYKLPRTDTPPGSCQLLPARLHERETRALAGNRDSQNTRPVSVTNVSGASSVPRTTTVSL